ncbi:hypothetical protein [Aeoliella mucimassa]|uniref:Uncharacterized protein n=1 Tax=Aeoliella mucimassa TaxID=2527972 RepID=A0A518AQL1_9BACT|nr:hypothetical protein [Aeoliella mucimassa]QDU57006.1 hypothetical protein Pan181_32180 [Aeoliella mucimassa]
MLSSRTIHILRLLLAVAVLHLVGACPCGCLEQNTWYQAMVSLSKQVGVEIPSDTPCEDEADCHQQMAMITSGQSSVLDCQHAHSLWTIATTLPCLALEPATGADRLVAFCLSPCLDHSLTMLQVMRL